MLGVDIRGDKVLSGSERDEFLQHGLVVEEKVDGANLGISFDSEGNIRAQNRGAYLHLPGSGQWKKLGDWLALRTDTLFEHLSDHFILFGEWCHAQHSVFYDRLPDWFLGFDIYDKQFGRFLSAERRDVLLREMRVAQVPCSRTRALHIPRNSKLLSHQNLAISLRKASIYVLTKKTGWRKGRNWFDRRLSSLWFSIGHARPSGPTG